MHSGPMLEQLRQAQRRGGNSRLTFVVQLKRTAQPKILTGRFSRLFGLKSHWQYVFKDKGDRLYELQIPGLSIRELQGSPFDLAYDFREALGALRVEPDFAVEFYHGGDRGAGTVSTLECSAPTFPRSCWDPISVHDKYWAVQRIKATAAWAYSVEQGRADQGEGILVAQPDTGVRPEHVELAGALDMARSGNTLEENGTAIDPLQQGELLSPGHGTSTSSVISSAESGQVVGVAPKAKVVPIRAINSVLLLEPIQINVSRAIEHAWLNDCHVVTMSLGGLMSFATLTAVNRAVSKNLIVMAAAGNCVGFVVSPAAYPNCIAVAGTNPGDRRWKGSCHGRKVDFSAPGAQVWKAQKEREGSPDNLACPGQGTSFAVALTAGVAALWLAHHGRTNLLTTMKKKHLADNLQQLFRYLTRKSVSVPASWNPREMGTGIINAEKLLRTTISKPVPKGMRQPQEIALRHITRNILRDIYGSEARGGSARSLGLTSSQYEEFAIEIAWLAMKRKQEKVFGMSDKDISHHLRALPARASIALKTVAAKNRNPVLKKLIKDR